MQLSTVLAELGIVHRGCMRMERTVQEIFSGMSELAKIEYLRVLVPASVVDYMHELLRIRAEAEAISSLDNGLS